MKNKIPQFSRSIEKSAWGRVNNLGTRKRITSIAFMAFAIISQTRASDLSGFIAKEGRGSSVATNVEPAYIITVNSNDQNVIKGVVRNDEGKGIAGATIRVVRTGFVASTGEDGAFQVTAQGNDVLEVTYLGYTTQRVNILNRAVLTINLKNEEGDIEEVVVTGVGVRIDRRTFSGATKRITGEETEIGGMIDPSRGLEGRVAGVTVQNVSGTFGTAPKIRVRGATSIFGNSKPLWVLDGVIIDDVADVGADALSSGDALTLISSAVAGLNANDIESFEILKDGSATSIYGAKGMAGVIVITTKKGAAGRSSINYSGEYTSRATPRYSEFNIMNSQEQMGVYQEMYQKGYLRLAGTTNASSSGVYGKMYDLINSGQLYNDFELGGANVNAHLREAEYRNTNWFKELYSNTIQHTHSLSLSSGNERSQYYGSLSVVDDAGWTKASGVKRYTANLNANFNIFDNLKLNLITGGSYRQQQAPGTLAQSIDGVFGAVRRDFDINPYRYAMNTSRTLDPHTFYKRNYAPFNILHELENNYMDVDASDLRFQGRLDWKILRNLELSTLGSIRFQNTAQSHHIKDQSNQAQAYRWMPTTAIRDVNPYLYRDPLNPYAVPISVLPEGGIYNRTDHMMVAQQYRTTLQFNETFADKHALTLFGMSDINFFDRNNTWFRGWGLQYDLGEIPFTNYLVFKQGQEQNTQYFSMNNSRAREAAFAAQGIYTYDGKYTITGTYRYDGSNRLGMTSQARWMPTWNVSGAWNVDRERFFENVQPYVSSLLLKGSYALNGDRGPAFVTNARSVIEPFNPWRPNAGDTESGLRVREVENSQLTYEKKYELNLGTQIGFFNNRINIEADYFKRDNFDLIGIVNTQGLGGQISKYGNVAEMKSNGFELGVTANIFKNTNFSWTSSFIYTHVVNEVTKLETNYRAIDFMTGNGFAMVGGPHRALYSIPFVKLNNEGLPIFLNQNNVETITSINFQERDKLDFLVYEGPTEPTDFGSFSNILTYKNFRLNLFFTYSFGNTVRLDPVFARDYSDLTATPREFANRWVVPGDEDFTDVPTIASIRQNRNNSNLSYAYNAYNYSTARVASGDFIRLKDVSFQYDFPKSMINNWKITGLSLRLNATNTFLLYADKKLNGQDPEFINAGGVAAPIARQYTLTLRLGL
ncbi:SusC/RagA family TonB-linked outer membrane protein [Sphingobacterium corticis]|uniref:SusC/RagA family TonB-linked outer membrane protein n=1 Tax=Sphingobacterium corticis TaxID=1812823 RepID=A0ABW5NIM0_9SPHI